MASINPAAELTSMGGAVPLGYRVEDRALHVVEDEAEFVRSLFRPRPRR